MSEPAISVVRVTKSFRLHHERAQSAKERFIRFGRASTERFTALDDVSFDVPSGRTVGLLGHNGSGKSTLLKCVAGTLTPSGGSVVTRGRVAALLELGAGFHPDLTGRENVYLNGSILGLSRSEIDAVFDDIVDFSEIAAFIDTPVKNYSSGMHARLGFAVAINVDPEILLVDEVLAVGDEAFQRKCIDRIKKFQNDGRTILFVTHDAEVVRRICDRVVVLDHGRLIADEVPSVGIRRYRESLLEHDEDLAAVDGRGVARMITKRVGFTEVQVDYASDEPYARPGEPVRIRVGYRADSPVDDIVFALEIHDQDGNRLVGVNNVVLGEPIEGVSGDGEFVFRLDDAPLLDGVYLISLGMHTVDGGVEYDHRDQLDRFTVQSSTRMLGLVRFPIGTEHHPGPNS